MKRSIFYILIITLLTSCESQTKLVETDPLPSWNEGKAKRNIISYVSSVTNQNDPAFIPVENRIAVFDNDGTLWSEKPLYFQFEFAIDMVRTHADSHPEWRNEQPFKGILEGDMQALMASGEEGIGKLIVATHSGMTNREFKETVSQWIDTARHELSGKLFREMTFQPMREVLDYLRANDFRTYIVSGGSVNFMQPWTEELYGIPSEQVIGSRIKLEYQLQDGEPILMRSPEFVFFNDKGGKPVSISQIIGKRPVMAFGNSDGDLAMLQYTAAGEGKRLMVYIHHTDETREFAYDRESPVGRLDKGLDEASARKWTVVDMKNDWNTIYPD
jgi:phosphoserine phosphatase